LLSDSATTPLVKAWTEYMVAQACFNTGRLLPDNLESNMD